MHKTVIGNEPGPPRGLRHALQGVLPPAPTLEGLRRPRRADALELLRESPGPARTPRSCPSRRSAPPSKGRRRRAPL